MGHLSIHAIQKCFAYGIFISLLFVNPFLLDGALLSKWAALSILLLVIFLSCILGITKINLSSSLIKKNRTVFFLLSFLWILRLMSIFYSINTSDAYFDLAREAVFILMLCTLLFLFQNPMEFIKAIKIPMIGFMVLSLIMGIIQLVSLIIGGEYNVSSSYLLKSFFAHRNMFSHVLVLGLPLLFLEFVQQKKSSRYCKLLAVISIVFVAIMYCRTAWFALLLASVFGLIYFIWFKKGLQLVFLLIRKNHILFLGFLLTLIGVVLWDFNEVSKQWHSLSHWHYGSGHTRLKLWEASIAMIGERLYLGSGLSSWKIEVLRFITSSDITNGGFTFYQRPHNDFLWLWTESGLLAVVSYIGVYITVIYRALKATYSPIILACVFGLTAYLVMAFLSFPKERMEHQVFLCVFFFLILSDGESNTFARSNYIRRQTILVPFLVLLSALGILTLRMKGEYYTAKAFSIENKWQFKIDLLERAENRYYKMDATSTPLIYHAGLFQLNLGNNTKAEQAFEEALLINPYHTHALNYCASIHYSKGNSKEAEGYYRKILELKPDHNDALVNLAVISTRNKELNKAIEYLSKVDIINLTEDHLKVIHAILKVKLLRVKSGKDNYDVKRHIQRIINDKKWTFDLFYKARSNNRTFEKQIELDVVYLLKEEARK